MSNILDELNKRFEEQTTDRIEKREEQVIKRVITAEAKAFLQEMRALKEEGKELGLLHILLTGGEPFLQPKALSLIAKLSFNILYMSTSFIMILFEKIHSIIFIMTSLVSADCRSMILCKCFFIISSCSSLSVGV